MEGRRGAAVTQLDSLRRLVAFLRVLSRPKKFQKHLAKKTAIDIVCAPFRLVRTDSITRNR